LSKPDAALSCRFAQIPLGLRISVSTTTDARRRPDTGTFGWHVLDTAVTALAIHTVEATEATESELTIDFLIAPTRRDEQ
jgi:serine/threonine-protein kinase RsbW